MNWKKREINLGEIKTGVKKTITFECLDKLENIDNMVSSCGCSTPKLDGNNVVVTYTPGPIPVHLYNIGYYTSTKTITITYKDGKADVLSIKAKITKN